MSGQLVFEDLLRPRKILPSGLSATHEHMEPSLVLNTLWSALSPTVTRFWLEPTALSTDQCLSRGHRSKGRGYGLQPPTPGWDLAPPGKFWPGNILGNISALPLSEPSYLKLSFFPPVSTRLLFQVKNEGQRTFSISKCPLSTLSFQARPRAAGELTFTSLSICICDCVCPARGLCLPVWSISCGSTQCMCVWWL